MSSNQFGRKISALLFALIFIGGIAYAQKKDNSLPHLASKGSTTQLIVNGKPFLILGGELGNSSASTMDYLNSYWQKFKMMHLNTIVCPVYWELIEPQESTYDFSLVDSIVFAARKNNLKLVFLWFGSWKNSMSCYVPSWIKKDQKRFPRARTLDGKALEILTPFNNENRNIDAMAFSALMRHIRIIDEKDQTVILVQVENEIGMIPEARDYSPGANKAFTDQVPFGLISYMQANKNNLDPSLSVIWKKNGFKTSGTWEEIFGKSLRTDELFMAWYFGKYTNYVAAAGKKEYPLPMYVNAALIRPGYKPGQYPSAGPLPHLYDVWKVTAPQIDFLSPDFYNPDFKHWNDLYTRRENVLFIPEHRFDNTVAAKAAYAFGHYEAIGFSPFSIESNSDPENEPLGKIYDLINQLIPVITANQGQNKINGVLLDKENPQSVLQFGDYEFTVKHSYTLGYETKSKDETWGMAGALIVQTADNEFYLAGSGVVITFKNIKHPDMTVGLLRTEEGEFVHGKWRVIRYMNGDQTHQGRHVRTFLDNYSIQWFELYNYN